MASPVARDPLSCSERPENAVAVSEPAIERGNDGSRFSVDEDQTLRKASVPFVPPKPKEFDSAKPIFIGRAVFGT